MWLLSLFRLFGLSSERIRNAQSPDLPDWRLALDLERQLASGDFTGALKKLPRLLEVKVEDPHVPALMACSLAARGQRQAAHQLLLRMDQLGPVK